MVQKTGRGSSNANPTLPLPINQIASQLGSYLKQLKEKQLPYQVESNPSVKRKYLSLIASLNKCYFLDIEFPYFIKFKKEKFNWKAFINRFGNADMNTLTQMCNQA